MGCIYALGHDDLNSFALDDCRFLVPLDGELKIGRQHQVGLFERLLGTTAGKPYLKCISRSHLQLSPMTRHCVNRVFGLVNDSVNPVVVGQKHVALRDEVSLSALDCIDFIAANMDGSGSTVVYLTLRLENGNDLHAHAPVVTAPKAYRNPD